MVSTPPDAPRSPDDDAPVDLTGFVAELRALRAGAGAPSYASLARRTGVPRSTLHDALGGERFPSQDTVTALVDALGGDVARWRARWAAVRLATEHPSAEPSDAEPNVQPSAVQPSDVEPSDLAADDSGGSSDEPPHAEPGPSDTVAPRRLPRRRWWIVAAVAVVLIGAGALTWSLTRDTCAPGERYVMSDVGDLLDARGGVLERLDPGDTVVVVDKHPPEYSSRYRAVSDDSGDTGFVDESKIDAVGDACD